MATGYVNIKGRGLKFCQGSMGQLQQKIQSWFPPKGTVFNSDEEKEAAYKKASDFGQHWASYWLVYFGLEANCIIKGEDIDFDFENTVDWVDSLSAEEVKAIQAAYDSTQEFVKDIPPSKKKPVKKK